MITNELIQLNIHKYGTFIFFHDTTVTASGRNDLSLCGNVCCLKPYNLTYMC